MRNITSWPKPPIYDGIEPPNIPESYKIFGYEFMVIDGYPLLHQNIKQKKFNKEFVQKYLEKSYTTFKQIVNNLIASKDNTIEATKLLDIHTEINTYLNECREDEALKKIRNNIARKVRETNENISNLNKLIDDGFV
ncbi:hypothetical protein BDAP_002568 [Binucleata daphniae]